MKTTKQRKKERKTERFGTQYHSAERVEFIRGLPSEISGRSDRYGNHNAHMKSRGAGGGYRYIVPLTREEHLDFDVMPEAKFKKCYDRTKQSIRDRAPHYHRLWLEHVGEAA